MNSNYIFSSESVTSGHPDKVCDTISDAIVDACLAQDPNSRVACETLVKNDKVVLAGEIRTTAKIDYKDIVKQTLTSIGYDQDTATEKYSFECPFSAQSFEFHNFLGQQSVDIAQGVDAGAAEDKETQEQGAGDQGLMFGYACNETPTYMPAPIYYAHQLGLRLEDLRRNNPEFAWLRPDAKTQVSMQYENDKPVGITAVVISTMHAKEISTSEIRELIQQHVIQHVLPSEWLTEATEYHINPTGIFIIGGPDGDAGVTGRKIIVDTYGGMGRHGGGAFSGKDASKVDRSAAYFCRWIAKNIVAAELAERCELQVAYAIGYPNPVSIHLDTFGTETADTAKILEAVKSVFSFKPADIVTQLDLLKPRYSSSTNFGHFGRDHADLTWENLDKVEALKALV